MPALRHYFASVLLHHGVDITALSEYLGHHPAAFTLSVYVHLMPAAAEPDARGHRHRRGRDR